MNNWGGGENPPPNKKTAHLNRGCLDVCIDKTVSKSCRKNDWGQVKKTLWNECAEELARMTTSLNLVESFFLKGVLL